MMKNKIKVFFRIIFGAIFPLLVGSISYLLLFYTIGEGSGSSFSQNAKFSVLVFYVLVVVAGIPAIFLSIIAELLQSKLEMNLHFYLFGAALGFLCGVSTILISSQFFNFKFHGIFEIFLALSLCVFPGFITAWALRKMYRSSDAA